ncbi:hypothetical protein [Microbacterium sp.]|uniref:hypothetical protein n=1 Tax=Microbacterium sp. TaxID=51671 RepID=UPI0039E26F0B
MAVPDGFAIESVQVNPATFASAPDYTSTPGYGVTFTATTAAPSAGLAETGFDGTFFLTLTLVLAGGFVLAGAALLSGRRRK